MIQGNWMKEGCGKMKKLILIIGILVMSIALLGGCKKNEYEELNRVICTTQLASTRIDFVINASKIKKGEDLIVKLYFGTLDDYPEDYLPRNGVAPDNVLTELMINRYIYTKKTVQGLGMSCRKAEYVDEKIESKVCKTIDDFTKDNYPYAYNEQLEYETMVVPADYFVGEMGSIVWSIRVYGVWSGEVDRANCMGVGTSLYYRVKKNNIILYDDYDNFIHDIGALQANFMKNCNSK